MASKLEFVQYAVDQMRDVGEITYKKMFGEYGIYCNGKMFALVCDDQLFFKITENGRRFCPELEEAPPYEGAKPCFLIEEIDDREWLSELARQTCLELPAPKPKKQKAPSARQEDSKTGKSRKTKKLDYKKEYPDLYMPKKKPMLIEVPEMVFIQVEGKGNPNTAQSYQEAMEILYGLSFGIKMNLKFGTVPAELLEGLTPGTEAETLEYSGNYVVPPLEGLWWTEGTPFDGKNETDKDKFCWISMIRQPSLVTEELFDWAKENLQKKKPELPVSRAKLVRRTEGLCCQILHVGPYDAEPESIEAMEHFVNEAGYTQDFSEGRHHHEIYLGDPRRTAPERLKTVIRHPVKK